MQKLCCTVVAVFLLSSTGPVASRPAVPNRGAPWFIRPDAAWWEKLSPSTYDIKFEFDVKVPMRDGVKLSANIWRPKAEGRFPVIFMYTPYDKSTRSDFFQGDMIGHAFLYNPRNPVPTNGGNVSVRGFSTGGPRDQRSLQRRRDILVFTSERLENDLEVTGRVVARLYAASTTSDTDFTAKLVDVQPDGYARLLLEGIIRARYRNSFKKQELITPGQVYEYTVDLWSVSQVFPKGHRLQVEISSSNFPKYDRNPNTGHKFGEDSELQPATQTLYHTSQYPSHIVLPVRREPE